MLKLSVGAGCVRQWVLINGRVINSSRVVAFESYFILGLIAKSLPYVSSALREKEDKKKRGSLGRGKIAAALRLRPP